MILLSLSTVSSRVEAERVSKARFFLLNSQIYSVIQPQDRLAGASKVLHYVQTIAGGGHNMTPTIQWKSFQCHSATICLVSSTPHFWDICTNPKLKTSPITPWAHKLKYLRFQTLVDSSAESLKRVPEATNSFKILSNCLFSSSKQLNMICMSSISFLGILESI